MHEVKEVNYKNQKVYLHQRLVLCLACMCLHAPSQTISYNRILQLVTEEGVKSMQ